MARRRGGFRRTRRRRRSRYWQGYDIRANSPFAPNFSFTAGTTTRAGAVSSVYEPGSGAADGQVSDLILESGYFSFHGTFDYSPGASAELNTEGGIVICIGLILGHQLIGSYLNSPLDDDGPLDVGISGYMLRCCIHIPIGQLFNTGAADGPVMFNRGERAAGYARHGSQEYTFWCEMPTKSKRRLQGGETRALNLVVDSQVYNGVDYTASATDNFAIRATSVRHDFLVSRPR